MVKGPDMIRLLPAALSCVLLFLACTPPSDTPSAPREALGSPGPLATAPGWLPTGMMLQPRDNHAATLLSDGRVLVTGGSTSSGQLASAELYDPATGTWSSAGSLSQARMNHTATLLPTGKVLVAGGYGSNNFLSSAELYDPATGAWTTTASLQHARVGHTATVLPNGMVLIAGGLNSGAFPTVTELYDPASGAWYTTNTSLSLGRFFHTATLMPGGKVLVTGGDSTAGRATLSEVYDVSTGSWSTVGPLAQGRTNHTATLLPEGKVLVAGGNGNTGYVTSAELYDPATKAWTLTGPLAQARTFHTATLLPEGKVLVTGGTVSSSSPTTAELYDPATGSWTAAPSLLQARGAHTATLLPSGRVLLAGGAGGSGSFGTSEVYAPLTGTWATTASTLQAVSEATLTLLPGGKVLLAGGLNASQADVAQVQLYDEATGAWTLTGPLATARHGHTATLLHSGKVLVTGGKGAAGYLTSSELYDPATGSWTPTGALNQGRFGHTATLLHSGKVLVTGGSGSSSEPTTAELYDPATGAWTPTGTLSQSRVDYTATLLPNGQVLIVGGQNNSEPLGSAELYEPATGSWMPMAPLFQARAGHTATLLPNGQVLVAGGANGFEVLGSAELYDPATGSWTPTGSLSQVRRNHTATLLMSGRVLVAGGGTYSTTLTSAEVYDPATRSWTPTGTLTTARMGHAALLLTSGKVLLATGKDSASVLSKTEQYEELSVNMSWRPVVGNLAPNPWLEPGAVFTVTGFGFRGLSEASGGMAASSPTDFPLLRLRELESQQVFAVPFQDYSRGHVQARAPNLAQGHYLLSVTVNGLTSPSIVVRVGEETHPAPGPETTLTSMPPATTRQTSATFIFTSNVGGATFACSLDGTPFTPCASPTTYTGLVQGTHSFQVRAYDVAGNVDTTPASHTWTIDLTPPETTLTSSPPSRINQTSATFTFSSEEGASFECNLDNKGYVACTSPATYTDLATGTRNFKVRARDAAGNVDATPVNYSWTIDLTAPNTFITSTPDSPSRTAGATFVFGSNETNVTYTCSLDGAAFTACTSPLTYFNLSVGPHSFQVRARDAAGNVDATPATYLWTVDQIPPQTSLTSAPPALTHQAAATFTFASEQGATFECNLDGGAFTACTSPHTATVTEGPHVFQVRAVDAAGNPDTTPASASWTVDLTAPETGLTLAPAGLGNATSATFAFSSEAGASFECSLDGATFLPCASPHSYALLTEGPHLFQVRARDAAGNLDATPASHSWSIDVTAPATSLTSAPASLGNATSALFTFVSSEEAASFDCSLDGLDFTACSSPTLLTGLTAGPHFFQVRARDTAGNVDASPAVFLWSIDLTAPETGLASAPPALTQQTSATFTFSSESGATLECSLDGAAFTPCTSPVSYSGLAEGAHTFRVRARDTAGNVDATPATHAWSIDLTTPETAFTSAPATFSNQPEALFAFTSNKAHATFECSLDGAPFTACTSPVIFSRLPEVRHTFQVRARSPLTGVDASPATHSWTPDLKVPDTTLLSVPSSPSPFTSATFRFSSNEPGTTFECSLDGTPFTACASPYTVMGLAERQHAFQVRARDAAGNVDASPVVYTWWVQPAAAQLAP
jgi:N-acetylneuraminic acid mutarotase